MKNYWNVKSIINSLIEKEIEWRLMYGKKSNDIVAVSKRRYSFKDFPYTKILANTTPMTIEQLLNLISNHIAKNWKKVNLYIYTNGAIPYSEIEDAKRSIKNKNIKIIDYE